MVTMEEGVPAVCYKVLKSWPGKLCLLVVRLFVDLGMANHCESFIVSTVGAN